MHVPGVTSKSVIITQFINQRTVEIVNKQIDVEFLEKQLITIPPHQWKDLNSQVVAAKAALRDLKMILRTMEGIYQDYIEEEAKDDPKALVIKKADK